MRRGPALAALNVFALGAAVVMAAVALSRSDQGPAQNANASPPETLQPQPEAAYQQGEPPQHLRDIYERSKPTFPPHDLVCFPRTSAVCVDGRCEVTPGMVLILAASHPTATISRCLSVGCDNEPATQFASGMMVYYQPKDPGHFLKVDLAKMKFVDVATLETRTVVNQGTCSILRQGGPRAILDRAHSRDDE